MPININLDITARRRQQELLKQLEALNQAAFGTQEAGPPTRFGETSVSGGMLPPNPFVQQLLTSPLTAETGISQVQSLLEQQRKSQEAQNILAQQFGTLGNIAQQYPELKTLTQFAGTPGFGEVGIPALGKELMQKLPGAEAIDPVQSSTILPDGTVQMVRRSGAVEITTPSEANIAKIKSAQKYGAELQGLRAGERGAGDEAIKASVEAFKGLTGVRKNISNIDEAIDLINQGASTGVVQSRLPSIREASIKLDNLQGRLGLDVIGNTTFGALSEAELKFALDTAFPEKLDSPSLKQWFIEKRQTQDKLSSYLEDAAIFLGTPGNTIADFLRMKKTQQFIGSSPLTPLPTPNIRQQQVGQNPPPGLTPEEQKELEQLRLRFRR